MTATQQPRREDPPVRCWALWRFGVVSTLVAVLLHQVAFVSGAEPISPYEAGDQVGETATVCGRVVGSYFSKKSKSKPTYLNFEKPYPQQPFSIVIFGDHRARFSVAPETAFKNKTVCVTGKISSYKGNPQIIVRNPDQISDSPAARTSGTPGTSSGAAARGSYRLLINSPIGAAPSTSCASEICVELRSLLRQAKSTIDFAIYGLRGQPEILNELLAAKARGVRVRGVVDRTLEDKSYYSGTDELIRKVAKVRTDHASDKREAKRRAEEEKKEAATAAARGLSPAEARRRAQQKKYGSWCTQPRGFSGPLSCAEYDLRKGVVLRATHATREGFPFTGHIMHNKFFVVDGRYVWAGSANISDSGVGGYNANVVVLVDSPEVAERYTAEFEQMYEQDRFHAEKKPSPAGRVYEMGDGSRLSVWFLPQDNGARRVSELIDEAKRKVNVSMFFLTHKAIAGRLIAARQRGVDVRVIVDATSAKNEYSKHELLRVAGVAVKVESWGGKMHMKAASVDGAHLVVGSMNWTSAGEYNNDENLLILDSRSAASEFDAAFERMWDSIPAQWLEDRPDPESLASVGSCSDGMDNDFDDRADAADPGCSSDPPPLPDLPPHWVAHH